MSQEKRQSAAISTQYKMLFRGSHRGHSDSAQDVVDAHRLLAANDGTHHDDLGGAGAAAGDVPGERIHIAHTLGSLHLDRGAANTLADADPRAGGEAPA